MFYFKFQKIQLNKTFTNVLYRKKSPDMFPDGDKDSFHILVRRYLVSFLFLFSVNRSNEQKFILTKKCKEAIDIKQKQSLIWTTLMI